jgi:hypothetical protein
MAAQNKQSVTTGAIANIGHFIGVVYNVKRLHSALGGDRPVFAGGPYMYAVSTGLPPGTYSLLYTTG